MIGEGVEELQDGTWLEEMKPGMVLSGQEQLFPVDLPLAPSNFSGVFCVPPSRQNFPRDLWADRKPLSRPWIQTLLQQFPYSFLFSLFLLVPFFLREDKGKEGPAETLATKGGLVRGVCLGSGVPSGTTNPS